MPVTFGFLEDVLRGSKRRSRPIPPEDSGSISQEQRRGDQEESRGSQEEESGNQEEQSGN